MIFSHIDQVSLTSQAGHGVEVDLSGFPFVGIWSPYDQEKGTMAPLFVLSLGMGSLIWKGQTGSIRRNSAFKP